MNFSNVAFTITYDALFSPEGRRCFTLSLWLRISNVDCTKVPPLWHPGDENITVLTQERLLVRMGEHSSEGKLQAIEQSCWFGRVTQQHREQRYL